MNNDILNSVLELINRSKVASLGTLDSDNNPHIKALMLTRHDGMKTFYFCSNVSSKRFEQIKSNPNSCLYLFDEKTFEGVCLYGNARVSREKELLTDLWQDGMELYYPKGVDDEDYCVIVFDAYKGNYYSKLRNTDFNIGG